MALPTNSQQNHFSRRSRRRNGELLTRTARWRARHATLDKTGEPVSEAELVERATWLSDLVTSVAQQGLDDHWNDADLGAMLKPDLPPFAYRALECALGRLQPAAGTHFDSRAVWLAEEVCGRTLRATAHQRAIITAFLGGCRAPAGTDKVSKRNAHRAIKNVIKARKNAGASKVIPTAFLEVKPNAPQLSKPALPLASVDSQFVRIGISDDLSTASLEVKLPVARNPQSRADWQWHTLTFPVPEDTRERLAAGGALRLPTLRVRDNRLLADFPVEFERPAPVAATDRILALDWGERRLLSATVVEKKGAKVEEVAGPFVFDARAAQARMQRQREQAKRLGTIIDRNTILCGNNPSVELAKRLAVLELERTRIWAARAALQKEVAHQAAKWATRLAQAYGCDAVAVEDLKSLESRVKTAALRDRLNHQVRGVLFKHLADKLAEAGIGLVLVNAMNTSALCPRCGTHHSHVVSPDHKARGRGWALCSGCGSSLDRDHAASLNVGAKALTVPTAQKAPVTAKRPRRPQLLVPPLLSRQRPMGIGGRAAVTPATKRRAPGLALGSDFVLFSCETVPRPGFVLTHASRLGKKVQLS